MRIRFINPNTTTSMTDKVQRAAEQVAAAGVIVESATSASGPASIQGAADGEAALPGLLTAARAAADDQVDVVVVACFDDTGIEELRQALPMPVLGIGQSAFAWCLLQGHRFSVVTTLSVSIPVIKENLQRSGYAAGCVSVRASKVPVLALEEPGGEAQARVSEEIAATLAEDKPGAIVLGCAGMADLAERMSVHHAVPVIDGVAAAVQLGSILTR